MALSSADDPGPYWLAMSGQFNDIFTQLESWYSSERGQYLLKGTRELLQSRLETAFGYHILQLGPLRGESLIAGSRINHQIYAGPKTGGQLGLFCEMDELPLESDSVDVVVAHHCLEFSTNPHQVLREIQRALTPQGQLLLIGFNPLSLTGFSNRIRGLSKTSPWRAYQPVSQRRLTDWLNLLGCELNSTTYLYTVPPVGRGRIRTWLQDCDSWCSSHNIPVGGLYLACATKQVAAQNRPRLGLRQRSERLIGLAVPKPGVAPPSPTPHAPTRNPGITSASHSITGETDT